MIILKEKVTGYNNTLTLATKEMKFGVNENVNKMVISKEEPTTTENLKINKNLQTAIPKIKTDNVNVLPLLGSAITSGFLISKYVI